MLGLRFCAGAFSSCGKRGPLFIAMRGPLTVAASLVGSTGSRGAGSVAVAHGPSCSAACGIFPDQGSNPHPLHWQADSQPLHHQGSPSGFSCWGAWALGTRASVIVAHGLQSAGSVVVAHGLSCSLACGIFPDQGSNLCPLHWQVDS